MKRMSRKIWSYLGILTLCFAFSMFIAQFSHAFYYDYVLFIWLQGAKSSLLIAVLFYLTFIAKSHLGEYFSPVVLKWPIPAFIGVQIIQSVAVMSWPDPNLWQYFQAAALLMCGLISVWFILLQQLALRSDMFFFSLVGLALILMIAYLSSWNVQFHQFVELSVPVWFAAALGAGLLIMVSIQLLAFASPRYQELYILPLMFGVIGIGEAFGREGGVIWWTSSLVTLFLLYLMLKAVKSFNHINSRFFVMFQQGLNEHTGPYFCGTANGRMVFANNAFRRSFGLESESSREISHPFVGHPMWNEIQLSLAQNGIWSGETLVPDSQGNLLSFYAEFRALKENEDWHQVSLQDRSDKIELLKNRDIALEKLERLSVDLMEKQEEERRFFAKELHDEIGQGLTLLKIQHQLPEPDWELIKHILSELIDKVRNLSLNLRPAILDDMGLSYALKWLADRQVKFSNLNVIVDVEDNLPRMDDKLEISAFRICQEAFTNIHKYAHARNVQLKCRQNSGKLELVIKDDGIGFDVDAKFNSAVKSQSLGLVSLKERAFIVGGDIAIDSSPERGTEIVVTAPIKLRTQSGVTSEDI